MTELTCTFDELNHPNWSKLFHDSPKSIHDIDVIGLCDKTTGEKHEFVSLDRVLEIIGEEQEEYRTAYEALTNVYNRVLALNGGRE